jgi:pimeloyl-ACP methyl ester carboxylesterase
MHNVAYPAGMAANSKTEGVAKTLSHVQAQAAACPNQKFVLVGYSQGADVMHNAAAKLPEALHPRVIAVVMFGDPGNMGPCPCSQKCSRTGSWRTAQRGIPCAAAGRTSSRT